MTWEKKRITVVTKAYPEPSSKHGDVACTAGITDDGEWIRLYPIDMRHFVGARKISKWDTIEVECQKDSDKLGRKESHKVRAETITIVDNSLSGSKIDWGKRSRILIPKLNKSMDELEKAYKTGKVSLGLIKPVEILDFYKTADLQIYEKSGWSYTETLDGQRIPNVTKIPHIFKYKFKCASGEHNMQCEDWELFESYRSWGKTYKNEATLWKKLRERYFDWMLKERELYFIMGMYSQYPTWFIIGIYYPPKGDN